MQYTRVEDVHEISDWGLVLEYSQTCVKPPYKTRYVFGFSDRWLLIAAWK